MARPALRDEQLERFRERLCERALERFAEEGYAGVTLRGLARELGCSHATPYRYFRDKQHIFAAVRALAYERFAEALERGAGERRDPQARLRGMLAAYLRFAREQPRAYRIMFELELPAPDLHPEYWSRERGTWEVWEQEVRRAVEAGVLTGDPSLIAHLFWAGLHGAVSLHLAGRMILGQRLETVADRMIEALLQAQQPPDRRPS